MTVPARDWSHLKVGDVVHRRMGIGGPLMDLVVTEVDDRLVHCGPWTFDRRTGAEVDDELGWGNHRTGSFLEPD